MSMEVRATRVVDLTTGKTVVDATHARARILLDRPVSRDRI